MRRLGKGISKRPASGQSHSQKPGPSTRRADERAGSLGIEVCDVCNICFYSKTSLSVHKRIHWKDCIFDCPTCNKRFSSLTNLRAHQRIRCSAEAQPKSPAATKSTTKTSLSAKKVVRKRQAKPSVQKTKKNINRNRNNNATKIMAPKKRILQFEGEYRCDTCGKICSGKLGLTSHLRIHKVKPKETKMAGTMMNCLLCNVSFFSESMLNKHIRQNHRGQDISEIDNIRPEGTIICDNCDKVFNSDGELIQHANICYNQRDVEDQEDDDGSSLDEGDSNQEAGDEGDSNEEVGDDDGSNHDDDDDDDDDGGNQEDDETNGAFSCTQCEQSFDSNVGLSNHSRKHLTKGAQRKKAPPAKTSKGPPKKSRKEAVKSKTVARKVSPQDLKKVIKGGRNKNSYECQVCSKVFFRSSALISHSKTHSVELVHSPKNKKSPKKGSPSAVTTPNLPYECEVCLKGFAKAAAYHNHKKNARQCQDKTSPEKRADETSDSCKKSLVLVEKLDDKLLLMATKNEAAVSGTENCTSDSGMDVDTETKKPNDLPNVTQEVVQPVQLEVVANGKIPETEIQEANEHISMEVDNSSEKISVEKEVVKDGGLIVDAITNATVSTDLEIVTIDTTIETVEVEIKGNNDRAMSPDIVIPLGTPPKPKDDQNKSLHQDSPVKENSPKTETTEKSQAPHASPVKKDGGGKLLDSDKKEAPLENGSSPIKNALMEADKNSDVSHVTKIVPKLGEDKMSPQKDSENSELKGIIDFINNDCAE